MEEQDRCKGQSLPGSEHGEPAGAGMGCGGRIGVGCGGAGLCELGRERPGQASKTTTPGLGAPWHHEGGDFHNFPVLTLCPTPLRSEPPRYPGDGRFGELPWCPSYTAKVRGTGVGQGFSKCGPWAFVRNGSSQAAPHTWAAGTLGVGPSKLCFNSPLGDSGTLLGSRTNVLRTWTFGA